jgi:ribosomal protein L11 methyltransferase
MDWFGVSISCRAWFADMAALVLESCGARGAEITDRAFEALRVGAIEEWPLAGTVAEPHAATSHLDSMRDVEVRGYFSTAAQDQAAVLHKIGRELARSRAGAVEAGMDPGLLTLTVSRHEQSKWEAAWKQGFDAVHTSGRIIVAPPWRRPALEPGRVVVLIDPGMAFGTGTHPTTRMCLEMLERYVRPGHFVADIGTGSGILAIAAAKLGARVTAWDSDPLAVEAARSNLSLNGPGLPVEVLLHVSGEAAVTSRRPGEEETSRGLGAEAVLHRLVGRCDVVLANIAADSLVLLQDLISRLLKPYGASVLSGIILSKEGHVTSAYLNAGFVRSGRQQDGEWVALALRKGGL